MKSQIKRTIAVLLLVCFLVSLTTSIGSSTISGSVSGKDKIVYLSKLQEAARKDPARLQGEQTPGAANSVMIVEDALYREGLLDAKYAFDGAYGTATIKAYKKWQRSIGSAEKYCDGIPGKRDLTKLGDKYGFFVDVNLI